MTAPLQVPVSRSIEQVVDGQQYRGTISIAGITFTFEATFSPPFADAAATKDLPGSPAPATVADMRARSRLVLRRDGTEIDLADKEYAFFCYLMTTMALDLYFSPQTRDANQGALGQLLDDLGPLGVEMKIGMRTTDTLALSASDREMLAAPKFGCTFP